MFRKIIVSMAAGAATFLLWWASFANHRDLSACTYNKFKVTAYYSPVPGQEAYYRGNIKDEKILNGNGTHGASWRAVYNGMLAAPWNYSFGTKIYFPEYGVWQVDDRWWAILEKWERWDATETRIDIYAWKGDKGLQRALSFWVQYTYGYVCPNWVIPNSDVGIDYSTFPQYEDFYHASLWVLGLWPERRDPWVKALQNYLIALWYMNSWRNTWYYGSETKAALCMYQQKNLWMNGASEWCGYFGPQTRYNMKQRVKAKWLSSIVWPDSALLAEEDHTHEPELDTDHRMVQKTTTDTLIENAGTAAVPEIKIPVVIPDTLDERIIEHMFTKGEFVQYVFDTAMSKWTTWKQVRILERKLQWLGYLPKDREITWVYDMNVIEAVWMFQLEMWILDDTAPYPVRGFFGERTREKMNSL